MLSQVVFPWFALASIFLVAAFFGRSMCAWVCPFGFVQDILGYVKRRHARVSLRTHDWMINIKYAFLAIVLFISTTIFVSLATGVGEGYKASLGVFSEAPFNALSPADTLFAVVPRLVLNARYTLPLLPTGEIFGMILSTSPLLWARLIIMGIVVFVAVQVPRSWCQYLCPQGALMAVMNRFSFLGLKRNPLKCTKASCRACVEVCPMKVPILDLPWEKFTHPECIYCLKCVEACSTKAIGPKFT
jgi:polyferredoxin